MQEHSFAEKKPDMYFGVPRAACYAFQKPSSPDDEGSQIALSSTAIVKYVGIEKRGGLVNIGRQLLEGGSISSPQSYPLMIVFRYSARRLGCILAKKASPRRYPAGS